MRFYYAIINEFNTCIEVLNTYEERTGSEYIPIDSEDYSLMGKIWNGTEFIKPNGN